MDWTKITRGTRLPVPMKEAFPLHSRVTWGHGTNLHYGVVTRHARSLTFYIREVRAERRVLDTKRIKEHNKETVFVEGCDYNFNGTCEEDCPGCYTVEERVPVTTSIYLASKVVFVPMWDEEFGPEYPIRPWGKKTIYSTFPEVVWKSDPGWKVHPYKGIVTTTDVEEIEERPWSDQSSDDASFEFTEEEYSED